METRKDLIAWLSADESKLDEPIACVIYTAEDVERYVDDYAPEVSAGELWAQIAEEVDNEINSEYLYGIVDRMIQEALQNNGGD